MADKILATFRIDPEKWSAFKTTASFNGTNASALLIEFVDTYLAGDKLEPTPTQTDRHLDTIESDCIDNRELRLDSLETRLDKMGHGNLDNQLQLVESRLEAHIDKRIDEVRSQFEAQLESLRGKLKARLVR